MRKIIQWIRRRFTTLPLKISVKVKTNATDDDLHIQYPTFEEFEEAVRKGKPCKLD